VGGVVIGLLVGKLVAELRARMANPQIEVTISLVTGYAAYLPADRLGLSGVLAAVTAGIYLGWRSPEIASPAARIQGFAVWELLIFLLNAVLFVLVGLQLNIVLDALGGYSVGSLFGYAAAVCGVVVGLRILWGLTMVYPLRAIDRRRGVVTRRTSPRERFVAAWSGMRGAVSLAAALAIPFHIDSGAPFPQRELIIFLTFSVILVTLVGQGLTLPLLLRRLDVGDDGAERQEEIAARIGAADAALDRLEELGEEDWTLDDTIDRLRGLYGYRRRRFAAQAGEVEDDGYEDRSFSYQRLMRELLEAQRRALVRLRNEGEISSDTMRRVEHDLDLEDSRLEID
jgi:monovalent cation/hydrogen antiporter